VPKFEENAPADLVEAFGKTLTGMGGRWVTDSTNDIRAIADPRALADVDRTETDTATGEEIEHAIPLRKGYTVFDGWPALWPMQAAPARKLLPSAPRGGGDGLFRVVPCRLQVRQALQMQFRCRPPSEG
jgi:hypothetical protein